MAEPIQSVKAASGKPTATAKDDQTQAKQPTVNMARGPNQPGDPVTNAAEQKMLDEQRAQDEEQQQEAIKQQEEEAKRQEEEFKKRQDFMTSIIQSKEGYVVGDESNAEGVGLALKEGLVYANNVQSGKGGLDVEERYFLSGKGFESLKEHLGPSMGRKSK